MFLARVAVLYVVDDGCIDGAETVVRILHYLRREFI